MKKETGKRIKLGIFLFGGIALFIFAIYFIGQKKRMFTPTITISSLFTNVSGLQVGNNVRYGGINIGIVDYIEIVRDTVIRVDMLLDRSARKYITKNSKAVIGSEGLMGNKLINIIPSSEEPRTLIKKGDYLQSDNPVNFDEVMKNFQSTLENAAIITENLAYISSAIQNGDGLIGKLISDSTFARDVDKTIENVKSGSEALKHNFLLKGYFKKKEREAEKKKKEAEKQKEKQEKKNK